MAVHPGCLVAAVLMLALQAGSATVLDALRYERASIASGQVWRLVSGQFIHLGWAHCLLNLGGLAMLATILPAAVRVGRCCLALGTLIGLVMFFTMPGLQHYAGFSGILYGLAVVALLPRAPKEPAVAVVLAALAVRALWPWMGGGNADAAAWLGAPPLAAAHLAGLAAGALVLVVRRTAA